MPKRTPKEEQVEAAIVTAAETSGWIVRKLKYSCRRGAPDRIMYKHGRVVFMEIKRPGGTLSGLQRKELRLMKERGLDAHVVDSFEQAAEILGL